MARNVAAHLGKISGYIKLITRLSEYHPPLLTCVSNKMKRTVSDPILEWTRRSHVLSLSKSNMLIGLTRRGKCFLGIVVIISEFIAPQSAWVMRSQKKIVEKYVCMEKKWWKFLCGFQGCLQTVKTNRVGWSLTRSPVELSLTRELHWWLICARSIGLNLSLRRSNTSTRPGLKYFLPPDTEGELHYFK